MVFFPYYGEHTRELPELIGRLPRRTDPDGLALRPLSLPWPPIPECIDRAGVGRDRHAWDKDDRCVFCDRRALRFRRT